MEEKKRDAVNVEQKIMKQAFTFSNGSALPKDTVFVYIASSCALGTEPIASPGEFNPYRYMKLAKQDPECEGLDNRWAAS